MRDRRLIVFSDPGGAKPCLALADKWLQNHDILVCSDREFAFFECFGIKVRKCSTDQADAVIKEFGPCSIYTGTSYSSDFERAFLAKGRERGVPTSSFVDHYTQFRSRFVLGDDLILPDEVNVLDERAYNLAVEEGIPHDRIHITGNPYHDYLRRWTSSISRSDLWRKLGFFDSLGPVLLFAPDPLSNAGGIDKFGSDERLILRYLMDALEEIGDPVQLVIKAHPNQNIKYLEDALGDRFEKLGINCFIAGPEIDSALNDLIVRSDLVIGMFSSLIVEAEILGVPTLRLLCGLSIEDPLNGIAVGASIRDRSAISRHLKSFLHRSRKELNSGSA